MRNTCVRQSIFIQQAVKQILLRYVCVALEHWTTYVNVGINQSVVPKIGNMDGAIVPDELCAAQPVRF